MGISDRLAAVFGLDGSARAVGTPDGRWFSYDVVANAMAALDAQLRSAGIEAAAPVAVLLRNRPGHLAMVLGLLRTGRCLVTMNPSLPDGPLCADIAEVTAAAVIADDEDWARPGLIDAVARTGAKAIRIATEGDRLLVSEQPGIGFDPAGVSHLSMPGTAVEMLTSGTTGKPKRIRLGYDSLCSSLATGSTYEAGSDQQLQLKHSAGIQWMPLVHIGGLFGAIYAMYNARAFVLMERFNIDEWHRLILEHRPKFVNLPPSALYMVLERDYPKEDFASLLALRSGAAPLDHNQAIEFERRYGVPVLEGYGATEFAGGVAGWTIRDHRKYAATKRVSVGRANPGVELRVVDRETFEPLGVDDIGLLEVRSIQIGADTGWVRTSDLARIDADGFLFILGRADSAIIRGGFKIMPDKVEELVRSFPGVREACVVGIADERLGQVPVAAMTAVEGMSVDESGLRDFLRAELKAYEIPVAFRLLPELPRTPSLKVSQAAIREMFQREASPAVP